MFPPVQRQLRDQFNALTRVLNTPAASEADRARAYGQMGALLMAAECDDEAEASLLDAHALAPNDARWTYYLGQMYRSRGDLVDADRFLVRTTELQPDNLAAVVWLANVELDQGRVEAADTLYAKALAIQPRMFAALFGSGRAALARRDFTRAATQLEAALAADPRASIAHYPLAMAYRGLGRQDDAAAQVRQRGDVEPAPPDPLMREVVEMLHSPRAYESRGDRALARGDFKGAAALFRSGLDLADDNLALRHKLATALSLTGDVPDAVAQFEEILRRSPTFAEAHYSLAVILLSAGRLDDAIERFAAAARFDPGYLAARLQLANALRRRGRFEAAASEYAAVLRLDPRVGEARLEYAVALVHAKQYERARSVLEEATRLDPSEPRFRLALARLLAAAPDSHVRDGRQALALLQHPGVGADTADVLETTGMAWAAQGEFDKAITWERQAASAFERAGQHESAARASANIRLFAQGKPAQAPWLDDPVWRD
jgi:tetratricopeptide (TPR) repeat protein